MKSILKASVIAALAFVVPAHAADDKATVINNIADATTVAKFCGPEGTTLNRDLTIAAMAFYDLNDPQGWKRLEDVTLAKIAQFNRPNAPSAASWCAIGEMLYGERGKNVPGLLIMNPARRGLVNG